MRRRFYLFAELSLSISPFCDTRNAAYSSVTQVDRLFEEYFAKWPRLDVLIPNAGVQVLSIFCVRCLTVVKDASYEGRLAAVRKRIASRPNGRI